MSESKDEVIMRGMMWKLGAQRRNWKRRYFTLKLSGQGVLLEYFVKEKGKFKGRVCIKLNSQLAASDDHDEHQLLLVTDERALYLRAESRTDLLQWQKKFLEAITWARDHVDADGLKRLKHPIKAGFLNKLGRIRKTWRRRHFILFQGKLQYFDNVGGAKKGELSLHGCTITTLNSGDGEKIKEKDSTGLLVSSADGSAAGRNLRLRAATTAQRDSWHAALVTAALELWERRGTLDVIAALDRVADPRERLARLFDITFGMPDEGLVEAALAGHSGDPVVGPVLTRVAGLRVDYLRTLFAEMGLDAEECHARAALTYSAYVGWFQLARAVPEVTDGPAGAASRARLQAILLDLARPTSGQASTGDAFTDDASTGDAFTE